MATTGPTATTGLSPDAAVADIIDHLAALGTEDNRQGMSRYGIETSRAFGVSNAVLRPLARRIKRDNQRALDLWQTGWREARLLAAFTAEPSKFGAETARLWANDFNSWEIVDTTADLFSDARLLNLIPEFAADEREFVRRCAFAMIAWSAVHLKKEPDETFIGWFALIERHADDSRNFVRKAVNWALRQIGKRSIALHGPALMLAEKLAASRDKTERWIGKDAVKELTADKTLARLESKAA